MRLAKCAEPCSAERECAGGRDWVSFAEGPPALGRRSRNCAGAVSPMAEPGQDGARLVGSSLMPHSPKPQGAQEMLRPHDPNAWKKGEPSTIPCGSLGAASHCPLPEQPAGGMLEVS